MNDRHVIDPARYLARIGFDPHVGPPTLGLLTALQAAHMVHVPFENLHVYHRRAPRTDAAWSVHKIVEERRGGWCFEVNGAFATLLRALGFDARHVSCQVWYDSRSDWGPSTDHLATVVHLDGARWFVDVGFGDCCLVPLPMESGDVDAVPRPARVVVTAAAVELHELMPADGTGDGPLAGGGGWTPQLRIDPTPRALDEFEPRSHFLRTDPDSTWHRKPFATRALDGIGSRVTLRGDVLRRRDGAGPFRDEPVAPADWSALLQEHFGLVDALRPPDEADRVTP